MAESFSNTMSSPCIAYHGVVNNVCWRMLAESVWPVLDYFSESEGESHTRSVSYFLALCAMSLRWGLPYFCFGFWPCYRKMSLCTTIWLCSNWFFALSQSCSYLSPISSALLVIYMCNIQIKIHSFLYQRPDPGICCGLLETDLCISTKRDY